MKAETGADSGQAVSWHKLSLFYWFYFAVLGALAPFWGLYLQKLGFNAAQIGELIAVLMATKIIAPNLWGYLADTSGRRIFIIRLGCVLAVLSFIGVFWGNSYWWLFMVMLTFSFFWNAVLPQFEAYTLSSLGKDHHHYSLIRMWGSIGFIVSVLLLGYLFHYIAITWLPWIILLLFSGLAISSFLFAEQAPPRHYEHEPLSRLLRHPQIIALFVTAFLVQASHGPYYSFFSIYASEHHYSSATIGFLWALGVFAEVLVFLFIPKWLPRLGLKNLLLFSLLCGALRWLVIAWAIDSPIIITLNQLLHASTFGIYHVVIISLIHHFFTGKNQGMGQALYSSIGFGLGGAFGSLYAGYLWESMGARFTYEFAAILSVLAFVISWRYATCQNPYELE